MTTDATATGAPPPADVVRIIAVPLGPDAQGVSVYCRSRRILFVNSTAAREDVEEYIGRLADTA